MKYIIELEPIGKGLYKAKGANTLVFDENGIKNILKPFKTTNIEDTNEYKIGYETGRKDGFAYCRNNTELIPELKKTEYTKGYNAAICEYNEMIQWVYKHTEDFRTFLVESNFYECKAKICQFTVDILYDLMYDHDIVEVIREFQKWQEEKKKAIEESIKVGDEIYSEVSDTRAIVVSKNSSEEFVCMKADGSFFVVDKGLKYYWKTGRNFKTEVEQLLSKLQAN